MGQQSASVKSVETLIQILEYMKDKESVTIKECAEELGLASSTIHKHFSTVKEPRFVVQDGNEYRLGLGFLHFGHLVRNQLPIYEIAQDSLDELAEATEERVWLKVEENGVEVPIAVSSGDHAIKTDREIGRPSEMHATAGGKAILAHLPEHRRNEIIDNYELRSNTPHTIVDPDELRAELAEIRKTGVAYNMSEDIMGVNAVGAPIIDNDGYVHGSIVIAGPEKRLSEDRLKGELTELIVGTTNQLGINISYQ